MTLLKTRLLSFPLMLGYLGRWIHPTHNQMQLWCTPIFPGNFLFARTPFINNCPIPSPHPSAKHVACRMSHVVCNLFRDEQKYGRYWSLQCPTFKLPNLGSNLAARRFHALQTRKWHFLIDLYADIALLHLYVVCLKAATRRILPAALRICIVAPTNLRIRRSAHFCSFFVYLLMCGFVRGTVYTRACVNNDPRLGYHTTMPKGDSPFPFSVHSGRFEEAPSKRQQREVGSSKMSFLRSTSTKTALD